MRLLCLFSLFFMVSLASRLVMHSFGYTSNVGAYIADLLWAGLFALIFLRSPRWLPPLALLGWIVLYAGNTAFIKAMGWRLTTKQETIWLWPIIA